MIVLGLSGSIGMGKSTAGEMLRDMGYPVQDADLVVHELLAKGGGGVTPIKKVFPDVVKNGVVDRQALGAFVFGRHELLKKLEDILHPIVAAKRKSFLQKSAEEGATIAVLEIPLLFETGSYKNCDKNILMSANADIQKARVLSRPGMTLTKLDGILARQMPDSEKRTLADFIIDSSYGTAPVLAKLQDIVSYLETQTGRCWPQNYKE